METLNIQQADPQPQRFLGLGGGALNFLIVAYVCGQVSEECCCAAGCTGQTRITPASAGVTSQKAEQDAAVRQRASSRLRAISRDSAVGEGGRREGAGRRGGGRRGGSSCVNKMESGSLP